MWVKRLFIAEDGTEFSDEQACREYEERQKASKYICLENYIVFYKANGERASYADVCISQYAASYAKVIRIPEWDDKEEYSAWASVVPSELDDKVCSYGEGWYFIDNNDCWESWEYLSNEYSERNKAINKIVCEGN